MSSERDRSKEENANEWLDLENETGIAECIWGAVIELVREVEEILDKWEIEEEEVGKVFKLEERENLEGKGKGVVAALKWTGIERDSWWGDGNGDGQIFERRRYSWCLSSNSSGVSQSCGSWVDNLWSRGTF